jgi:DNA repair exonuclease SbcCD ATPase subunit
MEATLKVKDVGGLQGLNKFVLQRGKVNYVKAPNASGKTSLIRALTAVLSIPVGEMSDSMMSEAVDLGIKSSESSVRDGFVNIRADDALVEFKTEEGTKSYRVSSDGSPKILPDGDEKFLVAGVLTSGSRIARQLVEGKDDFSWIVDELSYAARYGEVKEIAQTLKEDASREKERIEKDIQRLYELDKHLQLLGQREEDHEKRIKDEEEKIEIDEIKDAREKIRKVIGKTHDEIEALEKQAAPLKRDAKEKKEKLSKLEKQITEKASELESIDLQKLGKDLETLQEETEKGVSRFKKERDNLQGTLNLFQMALSKLITEKKTSIVCPLCDEGHITRKKIEQIVNETTKGIGELNEHIRKLNDKFLKTQSRYEEQKERKSQLKEELETIRVEKHEVEMKLQTDEDWISQRDKSIEQKQKRVSELENELRSITSQLRVEDKKIKKVLDDAETELAKIRNEKTEISKERGLLEKKKIGEEEVDPQLAEAIYKEWISYLGTITKYCDQRVEENREVAKEEFNKNIEKLMKVLGFADFGRIWLTRDNKLLVEREGRRPQQIQTLSTAERSIIATILQITLKKTYLPNVPFLILDDVAMTFDDSRKERIFDYLEQEAKENNWFILTTKLDEHAKNIVIDTKR